MWKSAKSEIKPGPSLKRNKQTKWLMYNEVEVNPNHLHAGVHVKSLPVIFFFLHKVHSFDESKIWIIAKKKW